MPRLSAQNGIRNGNAISTVDEPWGRQLIEREIYNACRPVGLNRALVQKKNFFNHQTDRKGVAHEYYRRAGCEPLHFCLHRRSHRGVSVQPGHFVVAHASTAGSSNPGISATSCARTTSNPATRRQMPRRMPLSEFSSTSHFTGLFGEPSGVRATRQGTTPNDRPPGCPPQACAFSGIRPILHDLFCGSPTIESVDDEIQRHASASNPINAAGVLRQRNLPDNSRHMPIVAPGGGASQGRPFELAPVFEVRVRWSSPPDFGRQTLPWDRSCYTRFRPVLCPLFKALS
jgi:hypothetical protein